MSKEEVEKQTKKKTATQAAVKNPADGSNKQSRHKVPEEKMKSEPYTKPGFNWRQIGLWDNINKDDAHKVLKASKNIEEYVMDHFYGDWYHNSVIPIGVCFFSWAFARIGFSFLWLFVVLLGASSVYYAEFRRFNRDVRDDMRRAKAARRLEEESETMEWLNSFLAKFWVIYMPNLSEMVMYQANQVLNDAAPGYGIDNLSLDEFTLGTKAPRVDSIKSYTQKGKDHIEMDWAFSFTPNDTDDMTKNEIKKKVNPKVALGVTVGKAFILKTLPILVEDMSFTGKMNIKLKLNDNFPHVKTVSIQFLEPPVIDYALKPVGGDTFGIDIMSFIPGLSTFVNTLIHATLRPMMYAPNSLDIDVEEIMAQQSNDSIGLLSVHIKRIIDLKSTTDIKDNVFHPYVQLGLSNNPKVIEKTKVKKDTTQPVYLETKNLLVSALDGNHLLLNVFHMVPDQKDDINLGLLEVPLADLLQTEVQTGMVKNILESGKVVGKIEYDLKWSPALKPVTLEDGTREEYSDVQTGIMKLLVSGATNLDISHSVTGVLNPYAEIYINNKFVKRSRNLRETNEPDFGVSFESFITQQSETQIQVLVKDAAEDLVVGKLDTNLQDLIFETSRGQQWLSAPSVAEGGEPAKFKIGAKWKAINVDDEEVEIQKNASIGGLRLHLLRASGLKNLEAVGDVDPYVKVIQDGKLKGKTPTIANTSDPVFNNVFYVPVANEHQHILMDIFDAEPEGKDRPLGSCAVAVKDFLKKNSKGYYLGYDGSKEIVEQPVLYNGGNCGTFYFSVSFIPTIPVYTHLQLSNYDQYLELKKKKEEEEKKQAEEEEKLMKENPTQYEWIELAEDNIGDAPKVKMTAEESVKYRSGNVVVHLLSGSFNKPDVYVHVLFDDQAYPSVVTPKCSNRSLTAPNVGEGFVRDLPNSKVVFRLSKKAEVMEEKEVLVEKIFNTMDLLKRAYQKPITVHVDQRNTLRVQMEFVPFASNLDPLDTVLDVGHIRLDLLNGEKLKSVDSNGKSDPLCAVKLNGIEIYRTDKKRKTLDPLWNESVEFPMLSRSRDTLMLEVYDWDLTHDDELLGRVVLDLSQIPPNETTSFRAELDTLGFVNLRATYRPEFIRPKLNKKGGLQVDLNGVAGVPMKLVGGAVGGATDLASTAVSSGVGAVADGFTKGGSFLKKGLGRKKRSGEKDSEADNSVMSDQVSETSHQTGQTNNTSKRSNGKSKSDKYEEPPPMEPSNDNDDSIEALPNIVPELLPPPQKPTAQRHMRNASGTSDLSSLSLGTGGADAIPGRVNIVSAEGFKSSALEVKVSLSTQPKAKGIYKTRTAKAQGGKFEWNESRVFKASPDSSLVVFVREHHAFGRNVVVGTAQIPLQDYVDKDEIITVPVEEGQVTIHLRYMSVL